MFKFILEMVIMFGLGTVIYIFARAMPRINDKDLEKKSDVFRENKLMAFLERVDVQFKIILEKFLRKLRIWILKLDNFIAKKLRRFKKEAVKNEEGFSFEKKTTAGEKE